jgi:hypothetical protein
MKEILEFPHRDPGFAELGSLHEGEISVEEKKQKVIELLREYFDQIINFDFMTSTKTYGGFFGTNDGIRPVKYESRYASSFEVVSYHGGDVTSNENNSGYIFDTDANQVTFNAYFGRSLDDTRPGNFFRITIKLKKGEVDKDRFLSTISNLLKTIHVHYSETHDAETLRKERLETAKEALPVLEAFQEIGTKKAKEGAASRMNGFIKEYADYIAANS